MEMLANLASIQTNLDSFKNETNNRARAGLTNIINEKKKNKLNSSPFLDLLMT